MSHKSPEASHYIKGALADSSDFGLLEEQSSQKCEIPGQDANEPSCFILGREIRNRINKQTNKHTNGNQYIHTLPTGMCG